VRYCEQCGAAFRFARECPRDQQRLTSATVDPLLGRVLGERYRVLERIGSGGMGQVYRAAHTRIACVFAVKVVWGDSAYDPVMQSRFAREAEIASCLSSRHIVRVVDFAQDAGSLPYLVMEHLDGPSLYEVVTRERRIEPTRAVKIAERVARGLAHAHERGVVHRDLKPENVLLVREDDEDDVPKILDFGVARLCDADRLTGVGATIGTPLYMSPEQLTGSELDGRSDLYALGVLLYEMLTGHPPFQAASLPELTRKHLQESPPLVRPDEIVHLPFGEETALSALNHVVQRLLQKDPARRYASARDAVLALRHVFDPPAATLAAVDSSLASAVSPDLGDASPPTIATPPRLTLIEPAPSAILDEALRATFSRAILEGAPLYNSGDHAGCQDLYRRVAANAALNTSSIAVRARLRAALERSARRASVTEAAWDLRYAFDDLLMAAPIVAKGDLLADETSALLAIAEPRRRDGMGELLGDYLTAFVTGLAARLRELGVQPQLTRALDQAAEDVRRRGGGHAALAIVEPLLDIVKMSGNATGSTVPLAPRMSQPAPSPVSAVVRERVLAAIRLGVPAFNGGDHPLCAAIYRDVLQALLDGRLLAEVHRRVVTKSLTDAAAQGPTDAAWTLRGSLDTLVRDAGASGSGRS
jgi:serine/threonine protein kinase